MSTSKQDSDPFDEMRGRVDNAMWELFRDYGRGYKLQFAVGGFASVVARLLELVPALIIGVAIDALFTGDGPYTLPLVPDGWIPGTETGQFWLSVGIIAATYVAVAGLNWLNSWAWNHFAQNVQHDIRTDTYDVVQRLDKSFFDEVQTGEIMSVLNNDVNQLEQFLTRDLNNFIRISVLVVGVGGLMLWLNWQLALVGLVAVPALMLASYAFVRIVKPKYQTVRSSVGQLNSRLENNVSGVEVIKAYNREGYEYDRVEGASRTYLDANWDAITTRIKFFPTLRIITGAGFVLTFLVGGYWVLFGAPGPFTMSLSAGVLVTFLMYSRRFLWPMRQFGEIVNDYQYAQAAAERVYALMTEPSSVPEADDAVSLESVAGRVEYDDVSFSYETDQGVGSSGHGAEEEIVLDGVSLTAESGDLVGLVGPTGAGKTTLVKLLMRLYDADDGEIRVDGTDITDVTLSSLRDAIGYVSQEPFLFQGTVRENVAYGRPEVDEADVVEAVKRAGAWEFVEKLPEGLETTVGERGVKLSGGQRQRISIARAILNDPSMLILDEATSHVDNETEVLIQNSLQELVADRTTFAIAHRLSTVRNADQILVLDDGEIVERGDHETLLAQDGLYANLWSVQVGEIDALPEEFVERTAQRRASVDVEAGSLEN
nr:ABC transporter ATP-binding protein [Halovivax sp. TS33]